MSSSSRLFRALHSWAGQESRRWLELQNGSFSVCLSMTRLKGQTLGFLATQLHAMDKAELSRFQRISQQCPGSQPAFVGRVIACQPTLCCFQLVCLSMKEARV